ncbi:MAG TPA: hypothetical protein VFA70_03695, partial [Dehalococcoidia bacterium]|nr:hypothetical protein [Dehalococcoidia bacterium]
MDAVKGWAALRSWRKGAIALAALGTFAALLAWACSGAAKSEPPSPSPTIAVASATPVATPAPSASAAAQPSAGAARPAATPGAASARQAAIANLQLNAMVVVRGFQREKLPVGQVQNVTAATDPDHELGAPGEYTSRVNFQDTTLTVQGDPFDVTNGGAVE